MEKTLPDRTGLLSSFFRDHQIAVFIGAGASHELPYVTEDEGLAYPLGLDLARRIATRFDSDLRQSRITFDTETPTLDDVVNKLCKATDLDSEEMLENIQLYVKELFDSINKRRRDQRVRGPYDLLAEILHVTNFKDAIIVTTNYDDELEDALRRKELEVKPYASVSDYYEPVGDNVIKVYKLHGDIKKHETILLRNLEFDKSREAFYTDVQSAFQNKILLMLGHSGKDHDFKTLYASAREATSRKDPTYVTCLPRERPLFDRSDAEIVELVAESYPCSSVLGKVAESLTGKTVEELLEVNIGIPLKTDGDLRKRLEVVSQGQVVVLRGRDFSGKTMIVRRVLANLKEERNKIDRLALKELRTQEENGYAKQLLTTGRGEKTTVVEATPATYDYVLNYGSVKTASRTEVIKQIGASIKDRLMHASAPPLQTDSLSVLDHELTKQDVKDLYKHFSNRPNLQEPNDRDKALIALASVGKPENNRVIIPLLDKVLRDHRDEDIETINSQLKRENEALVGLSAFLGVDLFDSGLGKKFVDAAPEIVDTVASGVGATGGFVSPLAAFPAIGFVLLGVSVLVGFWKIRRREGFERIFRAYSEWVILPDAKRQVLCARLDHVYNQPQGSAYSFFSSWFSKGNMKGENLLTLLPEAKFTEITKEIQELTKNNKELETRMDGLSSQLAQHEDRIKSLEGWREVVEKAVDEMKQEFDRVHLEIRSVRSELSGVERRVYELERGAPVAEPDRFYVRGAERVQNADLLASLLHVETDCLIGEGNVEADRKIRAKVDGVIEKAKKDLLLVYGEASAGKSTLLYLVGAALLQTANEVWLVEDIEAFDLTNFQRTSSGYALFDPTDRTVQEAFVKKLTLKSKYIKAPRVIATLRTSYRAPELDERADTIELDYKREGIVIQELVRRLIEATPAARELMSDLQRLLPQKAEGNPLYVKEAFKFMLKNGFTKENLNILPEGVEDLLLSILMEITRTDRMHLLTYYVISCFDYIPASLLKGAQIQFQLHEPPIKYYDERDGTLVMHSWYRDLFEKALKGDEKYKIIREGLSFAIAALDQPVRGYLKEYLGQVTLDRSWTTRGLDPLLQWANAQADVKLDFITWISFERTTLSSFGTCIYEQATKPEAKEFPLLNTLVAFAINEFFAKERVRESKLLLFMSFYVANLMSGTEMDRLRKVIFRKGSLESESISNYLDYSHLNFRELRNLILGQPSYSHPLLDRLDSIRFRVSSVQSRYLSLLSVALEELGLIRLAKDDHASKAALLKLRNKDLEAIKEYDQAIAFAKNDSELHNSKGDALDDLGKYREAIEEYDQAIRLDPQEAAYYNNKGNALSSLGREQEALEAYNHAIILNPDHFLYHTNKGDVLHKLDRHKEAVAEYDQAIKLNEKDPRSYSNKGDALSSLGRREEAIVAYDYAIGLNPNQPWYHNRKGRLLVTLHKQKEAIVEYDQAIRLNPNEPFFYYNKGLALSTLDRNEEALEVYDEGIKLRPNDPDFHNDKGRALDLLKRFAEAIAEYDEAIRIDLTYAPAHNNKGVTFNRLGRREEALLEYESAIKLNPNDPLYHRNKGLKLNDLGRFEEAIAEFDAAIKLDPNDGASHFNKALALDSLCRYEEAIPEFDLAIRVDPATPSYHHNKGWTLGRLGRYEKAIVEYDMTLKLDPSDALCHSNKAWALDNLSRSSEAMVEFDVAVNLNPNSPQYHNGKGWVLYRLGRLREALIDFEVAIHLDPNDPLYHRNKGLTLNELGRFEEAIPEFDAAIKLNPKDPLSFNNKGLSFYKLSRYEEAKIEFDATVKLNPNEPLYHVNKGLALSGLGRYEEAITEFDAAIKLGPDNSWYHNHKGVALQGLGQYDYAIAQFDAALSLNPNEAMYHHNKGTALISLERYEDAILEFERIIKLNENNPDYHSHRGYALKQLHRFEEAITECDRSISLDQRNPNYHDMKGHCLDGLGRPEDAITEFDVAIKLDPTNPHYRENKSSCLNKLGRHQEATREAREAASLRARFPWQPDPNESVL
ncbi:MAG: tetratricopeptide repeat protein [Candidatus Bathyarchaeia archaeon]